MPPQADNHLGAPRKVGVELEFAGVSVTGAASVVQELWGGQQKAVDPFQIHIEGTELGDVEVELDLRYAHEPEEGITRWISEDADEEIRKVIGNIGENLVPTEIACPPVTLDKVEQLEELVRALRKAGAEGTRASPLYAFGAQFNPEIYSDSADDLLACLRSFILLRAWLRQEIEVDLSRQLTFFAGAFPFDYMALVLDADYAPDQTKLISDYLVHNPTRNRELDLLPLFAWLDKDQVLSTLPDTKIRRRPTFHYRLPNALIDQPEWGLAEDWNRWVMVERLAARPDLIEAGAQAWLANNRKLVSDNWTLLSVALAEKL
ncbi:MAG: amidoligase family protein [Geminicoccaceae bacterium]